MSPSQGGTGPGADTIRGWDPVIQRPGRDRAGLHATTHGTRTCLVGRRPGTPDATVGAEQPMTIVGPQADEAPPPKRDAETPMGATARTVRRLTPESWIAASRPIRARVRASRPAAAFWTARMRAKWAVRRPATFNEKIEYKLAWDRNPLLRTFADKVAVRAHVADVVGAHLLAEVYAVVDDPGALDLDALPSRHVVKPSHASGAVIVVHDHADPALRLPEVPTDQGWKGACAWVRPEHLDRDRFDRLCRHWLAHDYSRALGSTEWAYRGIPRRLIVEEFLEDGTSAPRDFKFTVAHGRVTWFRVNTTVGAAETTSCFDRDGSPLPVTYSNPRTVPPAPLPDSIDEMIRIAEALGAGTDMVRVDLYDVAGRIVFGELTNYPSAARATFDPPEYDLILGGGGE